MGRNVKDNLFKISCRCAIDNALTLHVEGRRLDSRYRIFFLVVLFGFVFFLKHIFIF